MIYPNTGLTTLSPEPFPSLAPFASVPTLVRAPRVFVLPFLGSRLNAYSSYGYFLINRPEDGQLFPRGLYTRIPYFVE